MQIEDFEWDEPKIWAHSISPDEVEECFFNKHIVAYHPEYEDRRLLFGKTNGGLLAIVFQPKDDVVRPITAWGMKKGEVTKYGNRLR